MRRGIALLMMGMGVCTFLIGHSLPPEKPLVKGPEVAVEESELDLEDEADFEEEDFEDFDEL